MALALVRWMAEKVTRHFKRRIGVVACRRPPVLHDDRNRRLSFIICADHLIPAPWPARKERQELPFVLGLLSRSWQVGQLRENVVFQ